MKADFEKGTKVCSKCRRELPVSEFSKDKRSKDGLCCYCKKCESNRICAYAKSEKGKRRRKEYNSIEYVKEKERKRNNKRQNTFNGAERNCRGKSHIVKRDYELTEEQLQKEKDKEKDIRQKIKKKVFMVFLYGMMDN